MSKQGTAVAAVAAGALTLSVGFATHAVPPAVARQISNHTMTVLPLVAAVFSIQVARKRTGRMRVGWALFGAWGILSGAGNAVWEYYELIRGVSVPFPSLADAGYLGGNLCAVGAILAFGVVTTRTSRMRALLDSVLVAASVFVLSWAFVLQDIYATSSGSMLARLLGLAYPVLDIVIVSLIVLVISRSEGPARYPLPIIGLGLAGWVVADTAFAYLTVRGLYHSGHPADLGWIGGDALIALAALLALRAPASAEVETGTARSGFAASLPFVVAAVALVGGVGKQVVTGADDTFVLTATLGVLLLVVARQFTVMVDNQEVVIERMRTIDDTKNQILNAVSHELRTPLTFIKGATSVLMEEPEMEPGMREQFLADTARSCDRLEGLIDGLLDLGRLVRGAVEPVRRPTDLGMVLTEVSAGVRAEGHLIDVSSDEVVANVDPLQVERIVENLLVNATRHTPAGTAVHAAATRIPNGAVVTVSDNGPGVKDENKERIFRPFVQGVHNGRGTGIGLALVAKFAALHGGKAWVEDTPGGGATFKVFLADGRSGERPVSKPEPVAETERLLA